MAIERRMQGENVYLPLQGLTMGATEKRVRIREILRPQYRWGKVWHMPELLAGEYEAQYNKFPGGRYEDHLDAGAWAVWLALEHGFRGPSVRPEPKPEEYKMPTFADLLAAKYDTVEDQQVAAGGGFW